MDDRFLYTEIQVLNPTGGAITFSLGIVDTPGAPADSEKWLADDVSLGAGCAWIWKGRKSNVGEYIYAIGSANGLIFRGTGEEIPP